MNSYDEYNTGSAEVQLAADELVNATIYYASSELPNEDSLREMRALVQRQLSDLVIAIRREVGEALAVEPRTITPSQLAKQWGIRAEKVLGWIHSGKLEALNVATTQNGRPRYRIDPEAIAKFKATRKVTANPAPARRKRRTSEAVTTYF